MWRYAERVPRPLRRPAAWGIGRLPPEQWKTLLRPVLADAGQSLPVSAVSPAPMRAVVAEISAKGLGMACVVGEDGRLAGIITDGDLRRHIGLATWRRSRRAWRRLIGDAGAARIGTWRRQLLPSRVRRNDHGLFVGLGKPDGAVRRVAR